MKVNKLFLLAMGLVAVGCNDNQIEEDSLINATKGEPTEVIIEATVTPASRAVSNVVSSNDAGTKSLVDLTFEEADTIGVYFNNWNLGLSHENVKFTVAEKNVDAEGNTTSVRFTTKEPMILLGAGNDVYAYFPYKATETDFEGTTRAGLGSWDGYHYFDLPAVQEQAATGDYSNLGKYIKLISTKKTIERTGNQVKVNMGFRHAFSYLTLNVVNNLGKDVKINEVEVKAFIDDQPIVLAGQFAVSLEAQEDGTTKVVPVEGTEKTSVTIVPTAATDEAPAGELVFAEGATKLFTAAVAPIAAYDKLELIIRTDDGFSYKVTKQLGDENFDSAKTLKQNVNQQLTFDMSLANLHSEVSTSAAAKYILTMQEERKNIVLDLAADIELDIKPGKKEDCWGWGEVETITINGNNHELTFNMTTEQQYNDVNVSSWKTKLIINDANLVAGTRKTDGGATRFSIFFDCDLELNNVISDATLMLMRGAKLNNVTFNGVKETASYPLWLVPIKYASPITEQVVTIDGCEFRTYGEGDRGIQIQGDEFAPAMGYEVVPVNLTVKNTKFAIEKKAAILARTPAGATITIGENVDIRDCKADAVNHVWIDEETADYASLVTVKSGNWKIEGTTWSAENDANGNVVTAYADDNAGMNGALNFGINTIALADGAYTMPAIGTQAAKRNVTLSGNAGAVLTIKNGTGVSVRGELTLQGVTVKADRVSSSNTRYYIKNADKVTFDGATVYPMYLGSNSEFIGCKFELTDYIYTSMAEEVSFTSCEFNTAGKAILISTTSATVSVEDCKFNATKAATTSEGSCSLAQLSQLPCAAIEISNKGAEGASLVHKLTTSGNKYSYFFSGEWRIKNYVEPNPITVNGKEYKQVAVDGHAFEVDENGQIYVSDNLIYQE